MPFCMVWYCFVAVENATSEIRLLPSSALKDYIIWASIFPPGIFVHVMIYADESGTHDKSGGQPSSQFAIVGGVMALNSDWTKFIPQWQRILNRHGADYFHYTEWAYAKRVANKEATANSSVPKKGPYCNWAALKLDEFIIDLAASISKANTVIVGGHSSVLRIHEAKQKGKLPTGYNPYERCVGGFFEDANLAISYYRKEWKRQRVNFVFDQTDDREWQGAVFSAFAASQKLNPNFKTINFANQKDPAFFPLQAADLVAGRLRIMRKAWESKDNSSDVARGG